MIPMKGEILDGVSGLPLVIRSRYDHQDAAAKFNVLMAPLQIGLAPHVTQWEQKLEARTFQFFLYVYERYGNTAAYRLENSHLDIRDDLTSRVQTRLSGQQPANRHTYQLRNDNYALVTGIQFDKANLPDQFSAYIGVGGANKLFTVRPKEQSAFIETAFYPTFLAYHAADVISFDVQPFEPFWVTGYLFTVYGSYTAPQLS